MECTKLCLGLVMTLAWIGCDSTAERFKVFRPIPTEPTVLYPTPHEPATPEPTGGGLVGSYNLSLTASPSCATVRNVNTGTLMPFPDAVRVRTYRAEFTGSEGRLAPTDGAEGWPHIGGIDRYVYYGTPLLRVDKGELTIIVPPSADDLATRPDHYLCAGGDYWWERLGDLGSFELCGTWRASISDTNRITGTIDGGLYYSDYKGDAHLGTVHLFCRASDHQFTLIRR